MNRREKEIIESIFDGSDLTNSALNVDETEQRLLKEYSAIQSGLKQLDIPDHQLSSERLRAAILKEGLHAQPKQKVSWTSWIWMPVTSTVVAVMMFNFVSRSSNIPSGTEPTFVQQTDTQPTAQLDPKLNSEPKNIQDSLVQNTAATISKERPSYARSPRKLLASRTIAKDRATLEMLSTQLRPAADQSENLRTVTLADTELAAPATAMKAADSQIVEMSDYMDKSTGAQKAEEITTHSNVVIGG